MNLKKFSLSLIIKYILDFVIMSVTCSICHEDINFNDDEISVLNCGHLFHQRCLQQWLNTNSTCPQCRITVDANNFVQKLYPCLNEDADLGYKGSSNETKSILKVYEDSTKNLQKMFTERIVSLEEENIKLAEKNSKLEENIDSASNNVRSLQEEKIKKDEIINKLMIDYEKLKANVKKSEKNEQAYEGLQSENTKLKNKLSSLLNNLLSDNSLIDDHSLNLS